MELNLSTDIDNPPARFSFASFFKQVQDAPWYRHFLMPAIDELQNLPNGAQVLDVGTGPGKLIELAKGRFELSWTGVDIDEAMLQQARQRSILSDVLWQKIEPGQALPFENATFDMVYFCSVLFNLPDPQPLLDEALRVLRPGGKIVVLTPTGRGGFKQEIAMLSQMQISARNWTFFLWRNMTRSGGRQWMNKRILLEAAKKNGFAYSNRFVFAEFATVEILQKQSSHLQETVHFGG